jgi:hypothetical protein
MGGVMRSRVPLVSAKPIFMPERPFGQYLENAVTILLSYGFTTRDAAYLDESFRAREDHALP